MRTAYFWAPKTLTWATPGIMDICSATRVSANYKYYRYYHYQSSYYQQGAGPQVLPSGDDHGEKPGALADE